MSYILVLFPVGGGGQGALYDILNKVHLKKRINIITQKLCCRIVKSNFLLFFGTYVVNKKQC